MSNKTLSPLPPWRRFSSTIPSILGLILAVLLASTAVSAAPPHAASSKTSKNSTKYYGGLPPFKESETNYHRTVTEVPYYTYRPPGLNGVTRQYWIAVEEIDYDYAPLGYDYFNGGYLNQTVAAMYTVQSENRIGSVYTKAVFREYTDGTYTNRISHPDFMGFMGPIIRAEVGDTIQVTLRNMASFSYSFHIHGAYYNAASDGYNFTGAIGGKSVSPNQQYTYVFDIPARAGPGPDDPSSIVWAYYSDVRTTDIYSGLIGPLLIYKKGLLVQFGVPDKTKINAEYVTLFTVTDENQSNYFQQNVKKYLGSKFVVDPNDQDFHESNLMYNINGFVYSNLQALSITANQTTRFYLMGMGNEIDVHTAHWHASTALDHGYRTDVVSLLPATFKVVDILADNPGQWLLHCHVSKHMMAGMVIMYQINLVSSEHGWTKRSIEEDASPRERIAAE